MTLERQYKVEGAFSACNSPMVLQSSVSHAIPRAPPEVIPDVRVRNKPCAQLGVHHQKEKANKNDQVDTISIN